MSYNSGSNRARNFKSTERFVLGRFRNYSPDYSLNCTPLGPITITYHKILINSCGAKFNFKNLFKIIYLFELCVYGSIGRTTIIKSEQLMGDMKAY